MDMDVVKRYGVAILVVGVLLIAYKAYRSYQHFEWLNVPATDTQGKPTGAVYAIPAWRK